MHPDLWLPQRHRIMNTLSSYSAAHAGVARERETVRCLLNILVSWLLMLPLLVLTFPALVTVSHVRICACACCHALAAKCLLGILCLMSDMLTGVSQVHNAMCVMPAAPRPGQQRPCMFSASCCLIRKWCVFQVVLGKQMLQKFAASFPVLITPILVKHFTTGRRMDYVHQADEATC